MEGNSRQDLIKYGLHTIISGHFDVALLRSRYWIAIVYQDQLPPSFSFSLVAYLQSYS